MNMQVTPQPSGLVSREHLAELASHRGGPHVSIYLPTERAGPATRQNPIRLKNLARNAEEALMAAGMRPTEARDLLEPARALEDDIDFWQHQADGLALHIAPGYYAKHLLPLRFDELAVVGERFYIRPLLELFTADAYFYLLAISINDVRFFRCGRYAQEEIAVAGMPRNMAEALWPDDPERQQQFRGQPVGQASGKQGHFGVFHGSGDIADDETKDRLLRYFQQVDQALHPLLSKETVPLVLAAVDYLRPIFAAASSYPHLLEQFVRGNPDEARPQELRLKAWQLVEPLLRQQWQGALQRFASLEGTGLTSTRIDEVAREARRGRVESLFVARSGTVWAKVSDGGESFEMHDSPQPGDEELVDLAAVQTLAHGGRLYTLDQQEMPSAALAAAIFRY